MSDADKAIAAKDRGNKAFTAGEYEEAVAAFSEGIQFDATNHVLFSNRSAAYASMGKYDDALVDAQKTVSLKPDWAKGYTRKGAALAFLGRDEEAREAYEAGLKIDPNNAGLKAGVEQLTNKERASAANGMASMLTSPEAMMRLSMNPQTAPFMKQPDFLAILEDIKTNPGSFGKYMQDQRVMTSLMAVMNMTMPGGDGGAQARPASPPAAKAPEPEPEPEPVRELTEEEKAAAEVKAKADAEKQLGAAAYKQKDFETAIQHFTAASEILPTEMSYVSNLAATYFEMKDYGKSLETCEKALDIGRAQRADYEAKARVLDRMGKCYERQGDLKKAIEAYKSSLAEARTRDVLNRLTAAEKALKEAEVQAYIDPAISEEEKAKGNEFYRNQDYPQAMKHYNESIKRNPSNHVLYSNRAAAYMKLGAYPEAVKDCDKAIAIEPTFAKAFVRRGNAQVVMKEFHKAMESFNKAIAIDPSQQEAKAGLLQVQRLINQQSGDKPDEERLSRAMADPEIRGIMEDPIMQQVLQDMSTNPGAAQNHMSNPMIAEKISKLVAAGVVQTR